MKTQSSLRGERPMSAANSNSDLGALFDGHIAREFTDFDVDATMETMLLQQALHKPNPQRCEGDAHLPHHRKRPGRRRTHCELHSQHTMGLSAATDPANWEESRSSARRGNEIREWESRA